jgi:acetyltransferase-like isoleucine patch superfamily enzyme
MTAVRPTTVQGGVRTYLRRTPVQRIRQGWATRRLGTVGPEAFVDRGVEFLRHPERIHLGANTIVKEGARLCPTNPSAEIAIGDWTTIGYHTHLFAASGIVIGDNCLIAPFCYLVDSNHGIARGTLIREQPMPTAPITIGSDVWLGAYAVVLPGVEIADGAVVAAGAVVTKAVPAGCIVAGNPARVVSERTELSG